MYPCRKTQRESIKLGWIIGSVLVVAGIIIKIVEVVLI